MIITPARFCIFCLLFVVTCFLIWPRFIYKSPYSKTLVIQNETLFETKSLKYILLWTQLARSEPFIFYNKGSEIFKERKCSINDCYMTMDVNVLSDITEFDVVAFHGPEVASRKNKVIPDRRKPHQKYAFASIESAHNYPICDDRYDSFFNWTWTFKLKSDGNFGYIAIRNRSGEIIGPSKHVDWINIDTMDSISDDLKQKLSSKKKVAAWFVSNCNTIGHREHFAEELRHELKVYGLDVDIYGSCGTHRCTYNKMSECLNIVERDYYFYLSFENSFDEDYVTEKLLHALQHNAVPVVYGAANYTRFMPDGIYLNARELGAKALAKEMNDIMHDKERYYKFFKWRNHYSYHSIEESPETDFFCQICEMLHNDKIVNNVSVYENFRGWWDPPGQC